MISDSHIFGRIIFVEYGLGVVLWCGLVQVMHLLNANTHIIISRMMACVKLKS